MNVNEALAAYALRKTIGDALVDEAELDRADIKDALMDEVEGGSAATNWAGVVRGRKVATAYKVTTKGRAATTKDKLVVRNRAAFTHWLATQGVGLADEFAAIHEDMFLAYALERRGGEAIPGVGTETFEVPGTPDIVDVRIRTNKNAVKALVAERMPELPKDVAGLLGVGE